MRIRFTGSIPLHELFGISPDLPRVRRFGASIALCLCLPLFAFAQTEQKNDPETAATTEVPAGTDIAGTTTPELPVTSSEEEVATIAESGMDTGADRSETLDAEPSEIAAASAGAGEPAQVSLEDETYESDPDMAVNDSVMMEPLPFAAVSDYESQRDPVNDYLDAIEFTETEWGAYSNELIDLYQGLGKAFMDLGQLDSARDAFHQGVQIIRVNSGPNSPDQTNYLFSIADIEAAIGDPKAAKEVLNSIYTLNAEAFGENDASMLPILEQMLEWYQSRWPLESPNARYGDMERTIGLMSKSARVLEETRGLDDPETGEAYRSIGQVEFMTVQYVLSKGISLEPGLVMATGNPTLIGDIQEVSVKKHFGVGRDAFAKYVESVAIQEDATAVDHAEALAQFGDWHLVFERYDSAAQLYRQAYEVLANNEDTHHIGDVYFAQPTPVRFMRDSKYFKEADIDDPEAPHLEVSMTVTKGGDLRNIELLNVPDNLSSAQVRQIKRKLDQTRFRPRVVDGATQKVNEFIWRHPIEGEVFMP